MENLKVVQPQQTKHALRSRTVWINLIIALLAFIELNMNLLTPYLKDKAELVFMGIGLLNICVRFLTHQPIEVRKSSYKSRMRYDDYGEPYDRRDYD